MCTSLLCICTANIQINALFSVSARQDPVRRESPISAILWQSQSSKSLRTCKDSALRLRCRVKLVCFATDDSDGQQPHYLHLSSSAKSVETPFGPEPLGAAGSWPRFCLYGRWPRHAAGTTHRGLVETGGIRVCAVANASHPWPEGQGGDGARLGAGAAARRPADIHPSSARLL